MLFQQRRRRGWGRARSSPYPCRIKFPALRAPTNPPGPFPSGFGAWMGRGSPTARPERGSGLQGTAGPLPGYSLHGKPIHLLGEALDLWHLWACGNLGFIGARLVGFQGIHGMNGERGQSMAASFPSIPVSLLSRIWKSCCSRVEIPRASA